MTRGRFQKPRAARDEISRQRDREPVYLCLIACAARTLKARDRQQNLRARSDSDRAAQLFASHAVDAPRFDRRQGNS
jgi:hypothetical protein